MILIKRLVKFCLAVMLYYSGLLSLLSYIKREYKSQNCPVILMYHCVLKDDDWQKQYLQPSLVISQETFDKQMAFLSKHYNVISLKDFAEILLNRQPFPQKCIVITFDDGWRDNYLNAYPILRKYHIPATIFLTTDFINSDKVFWFLQVSMLLVEGKINPQKMTDILQKVKSANENSTSVKNLNDNEIEAIRGDSDKFMEAIKKLDYDNIRKVIDLLTKECGISLDKIIQKKWILSWDEVLEMTYESIDVGSHGCSHTILTTLEASDIKQELFDSKKIIEEKLGEQVVSFSYPNGNFNSEIKKQVAQVGYSCAVATNNKKKSADPIDIFELRRVNIHDGMSVNPKGDFSKAMFVFGISR